MLRASYHCGCRIDQNIRPLTKDTWQLSKAQQYGVMTGSQLPAGIKERDDKGHAAKAKKTNPDRLSALPSPKAHKNSEHNENPIHHRFPGDPDFECAFNIFLIIQTTPAKMKLYQLPSAHGTWFQMSWLTIEPTLEASNCDLYVLQLDTLSKFFIYIS